MSQKFNFGSAVSGDNEPSQAEEEITNVPSIPQPMSEVWDPSNFFSDYDSGHPDFRLFWKVPCVDGGLTNPCFWIPITCFQFNQGTYRSWWDALWDGFSMTSLLRTMVIKMNMDFNASPVLKRWIKKAKAIRSSSIVVVRKVNLSPCDVDPCTKKKKSTCNCGNRSCVSDTCGFEGTRTHHWVSKFPYLQAALVINLKCVRIAAGTLNAGEQCRTQAVSTCDPCSGAGGVYPSVGDPVTWEGGPGLAGVGAAWQVNGRGPNFPDRRHTHGLQSIAQEQYLLYWSSGETEAELRNPANGCRIQRTRERIPL